MVAAGDPDRGPEGATEVVAAGLARGPLPVRFHCVSRAHFFRIEQTPPEEGFSSRQLLLVRLPCASRVQA